MVDAADNQPRARSEPEIRSLGGDALVAILDVPTRLRGPARVETPAGDVPAPLASLRLSRADGGTRLVWALRRPRDNDLLLRAFTGVLAPVREIAVARGAQIPPIDFPALLDNLEPRARVSLVAALLGVWPNLFGLRRDEAFVGSLDRLAKALAPKPSAVSGVAELVDGHSLWRTSLPADFGDVQAIYAVSKRQLDHLSGDTHLGKPSRRRECLLHLVARTGLNNGDSIFVLGAKGVAVRRPAAQKQLPDIARWWRAESAANDQLREFLVRALAEISSAGRTAAMEFQIRFPLKPRILMGSRGLPSATIETAFVGRSGLFVSGWYHDPGNFVAGLEAEDEAGDSLPIEIDRFPRHVALGSDSVAVVGFVGFTRKIRATAPVLQPRFRLRLASGTGHQLVPRLQPLNPVERRALLLKAVPPQFLGEEILAGRIAPAIGDLQSEIRSNASAGTVEAIGECLDHPSISVVIPLYRVLDFLRAQIAAFAMDPAFRDTAEIIYVLDSPEQAADLRHLLQGLNLLYGTPITLAVMGRNSGYAAACNTGARLARGSILAMVNSDVIPSEPGWLNRLAERFLASPNLAVAGPKLLFEDGSIQHAGMYFERNHFGHWLNHHFYKGLPRAYAPACVDRLVPAVTGACLVIRKEVYDAVGGFTEDYVIGDYEDSDLCLKVRAAGHDIAYVAGAELYHLERQSIRQSEDYMRGSADRYNAWLHAGRWSAAMAALMAKPVDFQLRSAA